jgi:membrane protease YdiL (CAAX protease family)
MSLLSLPQLLRDRFFVTALLLALPVWWLIYFTQLLPFSGRSFTLAQLLVLGLVFPVFEELAFRGLIQKYLLRYSQLASRRVVVTGANGVTSLLFAAVHLFHQPLLVAALILIPSLIFGEMRDRYASKV